MISIHKIDDDANDDDANDDDDDDDVDTGIPISPDLVIDNDSIFDGW